MAELSHPWRILCMSANSAKMPLKGMRSAHLLPASLGDAAAARIPTHPKTKERGKEGNVGAGGSGNAGEDFILRIRPSLAEAAVCSHCTRSLTLHFGSRFLPSVALSRSPLPKSRKRASGASERGGERERERQGRSRLDFHDLLLEVGGCGGTCACNSRRPRWQQKSITLNMLRF